MNSFTVYSIRLANQLIKEGFVFLGSGINSKNPKYNVYFFENNEALQKKIREYNMK